MQAFLFGPYSRLMMAPRFHSGLQVAINGARSKASGVPADRATIINESAQALTAGGASLHIHAKDAFGRDSVHPSDVNALVAALRDHFPDTRLSLSTGERAAPSVEARLEWVRAWEVLPDEVSVNWHEDGAEDLATELFDRGVGIEVGLFTPHSVTQFLASRFRGNCARVLVEIQPELNVTEALRTANLMLSQLGYLSEDPVLDDQEGIEVVLHGEDQNVWVVFAHAIRRGLATRIGLEDTLRLPDGIPARSNADLVSAALSIARWHR